MRNRLGFFVLMSFCGVVCWGLPVRSQNEGEDAILCIKDSLDFAAFASCLSQPELRSQVKTLLAQGKICRHLGFERTMTYADGDRDYANEFRLRPSQGSTANLVTSFYGYHHESGASPSVPPDDFDMSTQSITSTETRVILPDAVAYDFLKHVASNPPLPLLQNLLGMDLTGIRVEHPLGVNTIAKLYLTYTGNGPPVTVLVFAVHLGGDMFGPLTLVE